MTTDENPTVAINPENKSAKGALNWKTVSMGAGTGIVLGIGGAVVLNSNTVEAAGTMQPTASNDGIDQPSNEEAAAPAPRHQANDQANSHANAHVEETHHEQGTTPETPVQNNHVELPETITLAVGVNDDMSYEEAFDAARAEVGPGGIFVWHNSVYTTYTVEEYNSLEPDQLVHYNNMVTEVVGIDNLGEYTPDFNTFQVIDVAHDPETGMVYATGTVDGHTAMMADLDNDGIFDVAAVDVNDNGEADENEMYQLEQGAFGYHTEGEAPVAEETVVDPDDVTINPVAPENDYTYQETPVSTDDTLTAETVVEVEADLASVDATLETEAIPEEDSFTATVAEIADAPVETIESAIAGVFDTDPIDDSFETPIDDSVDFA